MHSYTIKTCILEGVHSQILRRRRATQTSEAGSAIINAPKHIKGPINNTLFKRLNLRKRTS